VFSHEILTTHLAYAAVIAVLAGLTKGFAGFGGAMVMVPLLSFYFGPAQAVVTVTLLEGLASLQLFPRAAPRTNWRRVGPLCLLTCLFVPVGIYALLNFEADIMRRAIGAVVVGFALVMLSGWRYRGIPHVGATVGVGVTAGLLMGGTGIGGPPVIFYLLSGPEPAEQSRASIISYFALTIAFMVVIFALYGAIDTITLWRAALLAAPFWIATWIGNRLFAVASEATFRRVALVCLLVIGSSAIVG
jgi:uncharacterized membrane protein YfcA